MVKTPVFELISVGFSYLPEEPVFQNLSFTIRQGERISLLGANGCGKSTLLKMLCGLIFPNSGEILAFGKKIDDKLMRDKTESQDFHRRIGYVFQNSEAQLFTTRVWDEIAFGPLQIGLNEEEVRQRVNDVTQLLGIEHLIDRPPFRLSGGEKKKVAVASVLVMNPEVLILDEPTSGLDPRSQRWLEELLNALGEQGRTIIIATHDLDMAHLITDRALVFSEEHRLVYDGSCQGALNNYQLLRSVNLVDEYYHEHGRSKHRHLKMHN